MHFDPPHNYSGHYNGKPLTLAEVCQQALITDGWLKRQQVGWDYYIQSYMVLPEVIGQYNVRVYLN